MIIALRSRDGYLLIRAFNSAVLKSSKPWGIIQEDDIYNTLDTASNGTFTPSDDGSTKERDWTFRRSRNLTAWAL